MSQPHDFKDNTGKTIQFDGKINSIWADNNNIHISFTASFDPKLTADWVAVELALTDWKDQRRDNTGIFPWGTPSKKYLWINRSTAGITRWRFVVTRKGAAVVEKQTSAGHYIIDNIAWKHELKFNKDESSYTADMTIPRALGDDDYSGKVTRINFLRHYQLPGRAPVTGRWQQDAGDIFLMPVVSIIPAMQLPNKPQ
jgi:hypothetical protein